MSQELIVLTAWDVITTPVAEVERQSLLDKLDAADFDGELPANSLGQSIADQMAQALSVVTGWMGALENLSKTLRQPYFEHAKRIKATSDEFMFPLAQRVADLQAKLAEFEAEKKRVEIALERQRQAEAAEARRKEEEIQRQAEAERRRQEQVERERLDAIEREQRRIETERQREIQEAARQARMIENAQARADAQAKANQLAAEEAERKRLAEIARKQESDRQAAADMQRDQQRQAEQERLVAIDQGGLRYDAPKTEGVRVNVGWEFDITNQRHFAEWCWKTGKTFVREVVFDKRAMTQWINDPTTDRANLPGLAVRQVIGATVRKAKARPVITVQSSKVEL